MRKLPAVLLAVCAIGLLFAVNYIEAQDDQPAEYVGARQCFACHRDVGPIHFESRHALTLRSGEDATIVGDFEQGADIRTVQFPGEDESRPFTTEDVAYVVGTGRYAQAYLYATGENEYAVLPAIWNTAEQTWQPFQPAQQWPDAAYDWAQNCAGCHVTGLNAEQGQWIDDGVQCESCHGPGSNHVEAVRSAGRDADEEGMRAIRASIVLSPDAQICGQCHSQGTEPDNNHPYPIAYIPGHDLLDETVFSLVPPTGDDDWWPTGHARQKYMQFNEWLAYGHAGALDALKESERVIDPCMTCHSEDYRWALAQIEAVETGERAAPAPESPTVNTAQHGITCSSCHTIHIAPAAEGEAQPDFLLSQDSYTMCVECHNDTEITRGMHHPTQEMFEGETVIEEVTGTPSAHFTSEDGPKCASCHMPRVPVEAMGTRASHAFNPVLPSTEVNIEGVLDTCSSCHSDQVDVAGLQTLISDIQVDTQARLDAARAALTDETPDWVRLALDLVEGDGSLGIHNYVYTDDLLDAVEAEVGLNGPAEATAVPDDATTESQ